MRNSDNVPRQFCPKRSTLALCIIGDEILNGKTQDTNSHYVAKKAFTLGLDLREIRVIKDVKEEIIMTIQHLSSSYDIVFTSGGIGPTHDDVTYESVAKAFNKELRLVPSVAERMKSIKSISALI